MTPQKDARLEVRVSQDLRDRFVTFADENPGTLSEHARLALELYLDGANNNATFDPFDARLNNHEQRLEALERRVRNLDAYLE